jgi:phosphoglycolate phosphatase-like HAD superfamily hydrolase
MERVAGDQLAIFDIDGTLTATNAVDDECYLRAVADMLGVDVGAVDWSDAPHVSDGAIARWLWTRHRDRVPSAREVAELQQRFVALLNAELASSPERFVPIEGACEIVQHLRSAGWSVALATGAWGASAKIKLRAAGLLANRIPLACSDDAEAREDIVRLAWQRAEAGRPFRRVVSVGDGPWDVRTACSLGIPFVGIATGDRADRLRREGATTILPHFADSLAVMAAFASASVPMATARAASLPRVSARPPHEW